MADRTDEILRELRDLRADVSRLIAIGESQASALAETKAAVGRHDDRIRALEQAVASTASKGLLAGGGAGGLAVLLEWLIRHSGVL
jgi:hypothetical protein